jgi:hypothetical protein
MNSTRRQFTRTALAAGATAAAGPLLAASPAPASEKRPMTEWYIADALRLPTTTKPDQEVHGAVGHALEWLIIFNLSDQDTQVTITHYYEDKAPATFTVPTKARSSTQTGGHRNASEAEMPMGKLYGLRVQSPVPIVIQATRAEEEYGIVPPAGMPGRSFLSRLGYPGPLGQRETAWVYADSCVQRANPRAKEFEWLTVLNPTPGRDAHVKVTFNGNRQTVHSFTVGAERVRTIDMQQVEAHPDHAIVGVLVQGDVPVVVEQIRRYVFRAHPAPAGTWIVTGYPVGDSNLKAISAF